MLKVPAVFRFFARFRARQKRLLVIKTDAIGDYILFRNYLEVLRCSEKFKDYRIDMLGNSLWRDVALQYDAAFINNFYFIRQYDLYEAPLKTLKVGWRLFKNNYEVVLQPSSTRIFITDGLAALTAAKHITGFESDTEGIPAQYKVKTDKFYTRRLVRPADVYFEFDRSRFFFESVTESSIPINSPGIPVNRDEKKGIVVFPGAGIIKRSWEACKFIELIKLIKLQSTEMVILAGGPGDVLICEQIAASFPPGTVNNLTGKTTLPQLIDLIGNAVLVIANETSAIHIAAATQTTAICILGGGHFGRFAPYPEYMRHRPVCVYQKMDCFNCNWDCIFRTEADEPYPCVAIVELEAVWQEVSLVLAEKELPKNN